MFYRVGVWIFCVEWIRQAVRGSFPWASAYRKLDRGLQSRLSHPRNIGNQSHLPSECGCGELFNSSEAFVASAATGTRLTDCRTEGRAWTRVAYVVESTYTSLAILHSSSTLYSCGLIYMHLAEALAHRCYKTLVITRTGTRVCFRRDVPRWSS